MRLEELQQLLWGFASQRVITVAARVGVLRCLAEHPKTAQAVAADLGLDGAATDKVVRSLTALGVLEAEGESYRVTPELAAHFRAGSDDISPFIGHLHTMYERWGENLEPWLRGDGWSTHQRTPEEIQAFGAAMRAMGTQVARMVVADLDLSTVNRVLDVGGGFGHFARTLCDARPGLTAVVLDTPEVSQNAVAAFRGTPYEDRISYLSGDYLTTDYGSGFDLVLLANVLHQEHAESAAEMIRRSARALAASGRLAVVDFSIDEDRRSHVFGTLFAINMRSFGDTHTESRISTWMTDAGLVDVHRVDLSELRWMIVGRRRSGS